MEKSSNQTQPISTPRIHRNLLLVTKCLGFLLGEISGYLWIEESSWKVFSSMEVFAEKKYGDYHVDIPTAQCNSASVWHLIICRLPLGCCGGYS